MWPFQLKPIPPGYEIRLKKNSYGGWYGQVYFEDVFQDEVYKLFPCFGSAQRAAARGARKLAFKLTQAPNSKLIAFYSGQRKS